VQPRRRGQKTPRRPSWAASGTVVAMSVQLAPLPPSPPSQPASGRAGRGRLRQTPAALPQPRLEHLLVAAAAVALRTSNTRGEEPHGRDRRGLPPTRTASHARTRHVVHPLRTANCASPPASRSPPSPFRSCCYGPAAMDPPLARGPRKPREASASPRPRDKHLKSPGLHHPAA
jgi:hypothetical protein